MEGMKLLCSGGVIIYDWCYENNSLVDNTYYTLFFGLDILYTVFYESR